jgi:hypothetical protein
MGSKARAKMIICD